MKLYYWLRATCKCHFLLFYFWNEIESDDSVETFIEKRLRTSPVGLLSQFWVAKRERERRHAAPYVGQHDSKKASFDAFSYKLDMLIHIQRKILVLFKHQRSLIAFVISGKILKLSVRELQFLPQFENAWIDFVWRVSSRLFVQCWFLRNLTFLHHRSMFFSLSRAFSFFSAHRKGSNNSHKNFSIEHSEENIG